MRSRDMCVCVYVCVCRVHTRERVSIFFVSDTSTLSTSRNRSVSACDTWILSFSWVHDAVSIDCQHVCGVLEQSFHLLSGRTYHRIVGYFGSPVPVRSNCTDTVLRDIDLVEGAQQICASSILRALPPCLFPPRDPPRTLSARRFRRPLFPQVLLFVAYQMNLGRSYVVCKNFLTLYTPAATDLTLYLHFLDQNLE